ncbi:chromatin assembly factor 1 subunit A-B-like [Hetaerina americana]|uniref:chromatin assembly factor 1 subunit A-B-like n=1 Tax=Hetaerina americana TaxID=62018 RepID=UPI003A7F5DC7
MKTVDIPTGDVDDGSPVETPIKKLRQALLPFQIVSTVGISSTPNMPSKKRKLTEPSSNGKISKNIRLEKRTETKENIVINTQKHDASTILNTSDESLSKSINATPVDEESLCLHLDDETDQPKVDCEAVNDAQDCINKKKEGSPTNRGKKGVPNNENEELMESSDDARVISCSSIDLDSTDENAVSDANKTDDAKCKKLSQNDSDAKSSLSESEGLAMLSSTDVSTPTRLPSDVGSPTVVLKKRTLSSQQKEQRAKVKEQLEKVKREKTLEKERLREQKLAQKKKIQQERLSMKLEEKQKKEEERRQRQKQKEEERLKKEEKKEEERQKKEEERQKKEEERQKKEEERQKKEEERQRKEEERQRKEEEKKKEEEEEQKKKEKAAAAFASFFLPRRSVQSKVSEEQKVAERKFMPFMIKGDMRLAPLVRVNLNQPEKEVIDVKLSRQSEKKLYLHELKEKLHCPKTHSATWPLSELKDDIIVIDDDDVPPGGNGDGVVLDTHQDLHLRAKLLQFCENQRPPYWGTWRKKSKKVGPRCPFHKDDKYFDYEVDSDDEWEEEEPGESLHGSDDEKESEDEYEVDNEFFVPHGYLSNEEADGEEDENVVSPEIQKAKLKLLGIEFEEEMKQQTKQIKPQLLGCFWSFGKTVDENLNHQYERILMPYKAVICCDHIPTSFTTPSSSIIGTVSGGQVDGASVGRKKSVFPETAIPDLIKLIHGNINGWRFLVLEFLTYWKKKNDHKAQSKEVEGDIPPSTPSSKSAISKLSTARKIKELASWIQFPEGSVMTGKYAWCVTEETRAQFGLTDLSLPNSWKYHLKPVKKNEVKSTPTSPSAAVCEVPIESPNSTKPHLITKFTKVMSKEERLKQLKQRPKISGSPQCGTASLQKQAPEIIEVDVISTSQTSNMKPSQSVSSGPDAKPRKRVPLLVSVPRGQEIPKSYSLSSFLKKSDVVQGSSSSFKTKSPGTADVKSKQLLSSEEKEVECIVLN